MQAASSNTIKSLPSSAKSPARLRARYAVAILCVLCLSIAGYVWVALALDRLRSDAAQINVAGRQRMLSQKLAKDTLALHTLTDPATRRPRIDELRATIDAWSAGHAALVDGDRSIGMPAVTSNDARSALQALEPGIRRAVAAAESALRSVQRGEAIGAGQIDAILEAESEFLPRMNAIVGTLEAESNSKLGAVRRARQALLLLTVLILLVEVLVVFEPATRAIRRAMERLELARRNAEAVADAKHRFLHQMGHELRTPLTAIMGYGDLLSDEAAGPGERRHAAAAIRRQSAQLLDLIEDVLDHAQLEGGAFETEPGETQIVALLTSAIGTKAADARAKGIAMSHRIEPGVPRTAMLDKRIIGRVLSHLVSNAVKFTETGEIRVAVRRDQGDLVFEVRDTGIGMSSRDRERVFEAFQQADTSASRRFGGAGLGLTLCHQFAASLGGRIDVDSQEGVGSTVWLRVPCIACDRTDDAAKDDEPVTAGSGEREGVLKGTVLLVVDDAADNRHLAAAFLQRAGARVVTATNGLEAVQAVERRTPGESGFDAVLMDMQMPVMDGLEATRRLRAAGFARPVIALTANALARDRQACQQAGCSGHLSKPFGRAALVETVRLAVLESRQDGRSAA